MNGAETSAEVGTEYIKTIVIKPHYATDHTQIELRVNDIVYVLEEDETGWWGGHKEGEERTGWFPGSCVRQILESGPEEKKASPTRRSSALETEGEAPGRRSRAVASPMRKSLPGLGLSKVAELPLPGTPWGTASDVIGLEDVREPLHSKGEKESAVATDQQLQALGVENAQLKKENTEMANRLKQLKRQSDADQHTLQRLEASAEQERQKYEKVEAAAKSLARQLEAAADERNTLLAKANALQAQLLQERRVSQPQAQALKDTRALDGSARSLLYAVESPVGHAASQLMPVATAMASPDPSGSPAPGASLRKPSCTPTERPPNEEPVRGIVAEKVSLFAAMLQKPKPKSPGRCSRRSASCSQLREGRIIPAGGAAAEPAAPQTAVLTHCRPLALGAEVASNEETEVFMGMSPIARGLPV